MSIEVSPAAPSIANGLTQQFTATGLYSDDSTQDLTTQVTWASSDPAVATVSNAAGSNGLATTAGVGSTTVSATSDGVTGDATLTVIAAPLTVDQMVAALLSCGDGRRAGEQSQKQGDGSAGRPRGARYSVGVQQAG